MPRGRPVRSDIRQALVEILADMKKAYGYEIYKVYDALFPKATLRAVYYNLRKGIDLGEFQIHKVTSEKGDYSWGTEAEKTYYELGPNAKPVGDAKVKEFFSNAPKEKTE